MLYEFSEKDWKLFRAKSLQWQEAYMDRLNKEYIELLRGNYHCHIRYAEG